MAGALPAEPIPTKDQADTISIQTFAEENRKPPQSISQNAELITAKGNIVTKDGVVFSTQDSDSSLSSNIFADPEVRDYYKKVYEDAQYECRHVFDADATWSEEEEKRVIRKLDYRGLSLNLHRMPKLSLMPNSLLLGMCHVLQLTN